MPRYYGNRGCGGRGGCQNFVQCGNGNGNGTNGCRQLGPFVAVDPNCVVTPDEPVPGAAAGAIIPFASGIVPAILSTIEVPVLGTIANTASLVGFGTSIPGVSLLGLEIDLLGALNEAFSVPRDGLITAISAAFTVTVGLDIAGPVDIVAEVYRAEEGSNTFTPTGARVELGPVTNLLAIGDTIADSNSDFPPVPVSTGDRLLMVFSIEGATVVAAITGGASAGITIE